MRAVLSALVAAAVLIAPLAATAAPVSLPSDPTERAASCAAALTVVSGASAGKPMTFETADRIGHFGMIGSQGDASRMGPLGERVAALMKGMNDPAVAQATLSACDKAYPQTLASATVRLPTDRLDRGLGCLIVAATMGGIHSGVGTAEDPRAATYKSLMNSLPPALDADATKAGLTTEDALLAKLNALGKDVGGYGPPFKVAAACAKEFG